MSLDKKLERHPFDRRLSEPRREAERHLHYALENLKAAALALGDSEPRGADDAQYDSEFRAVQAVRDAAENYRRAEEAAR